MLEVRGLTVSVGDAALVGPVSFSVDSGENFVIMGETGAGKSLLAQAIMGNLPPGLKERAKSFCKPASGHAEHDGARTTLGS